MVSACGGGERQDAHEPHRAFKLSITNATFPEKQRLADKTTMTIAVKNDDTATIPNVAVTVATDPGDAGGAPQAFSQDIADPNVSDPSRPIWIIDEPPKGGVTAFTNTWALGPLKAGQTKTFEWHVTAVKAGDYKINYSAAPGLNGKATPSGDHHTGSFTVNVTRTPPVQSVNGKGEVVTQPDS
ncbi:MAG: hypothetical protein QOF76_2921 [Solirubrobacteraceae bacterium]|nr:hypothetical protein [Solirubrobacteraceae bacterium]